MGLSSAVTWWEEWQLRILVLTSLFIQYILYFSFTVRTNPFLHRLRVLVWIAYVSSDAVAIFSLTTLFNRHTKICDGEGSNLEVLWAPLLLIHLGGQPFISAYSLEDNELWKRHTVALVSQVMVALYVFCRWWSGEKKLLAVAVLLFIIGILRFAQKPWSLRLASFNSFQASSTVPMPTVQRVFTLEDYVQAAKRCVLDTKVDSPYEYNLTRADISRVYEIKSDYMFVDRSAPYSIRIEKLQYFLNLEYRHAYRMLHKCLQKTFERLYAKAGSLSGTGLISLLLLPFLTLASMVLFAMSRKDDQNKKDIRVTYILLCCTTMLEFMPHIELLCLLFPWYNNFYYLSPGWEALVAQHNIMSLCVRKKNPTFLMKLATFNFLRELVNQHWYIQQVPVAYQIARTVRQHVEDGWKKYIRDATSYRTFSELRGQWALRRHRQLRWSFNMAFDESVLIWHVATDLCFYHPNTSLQCRQGEATQRGREISNYMFYLLMVRPEMLLPGTRSDLFTLANERLMDIIKGLLYMTEEILVREILNMTMLSSSNDMISNALKLARALMQLGSEEERWIAVQGVWVEMLCYSANRCRGYLHAKSMGDGGECLTIIWLLLSSMGMETFADRHHRSETPEEEADEP